MTKPHEVPLVEGVVGNTTHCRLKVENFSGLVRTDPYAPPFFTCHRPYRDLKE